MSAARGALLLVLVVGPARRAVAGDAAPELGGHRFVPSALVEWSFVDTEVSSTTAAGLVEAAPAGHAIARVRGALAPAFLTAAQTLAGSAAIGSIVALSARVTDSGLVSSVPATALAEGVHLTAGGAIGAAVRLVRAGALQLAARAEYEHTWSEELVPARGPAPPQVTGKETTVRPALAAAAALSPYVGIQASGAIAWRRAEGDGATTVIGALATTLAIDPVTLLVGGTTERRGQVGLFYGDRRELDLGGSLVFDLDGPARRLLGELRLGYYF